MMNNIYLMGFMGSGKTSTGRVLAKKIKAPFADTDLLIWELSGMTPGEFIKKRGCGAWRKAERSVLRAIAACEGRVIALGGGIMPVKTLRPLFKKSGTTIYLKCAEAELLKRLSRGLDKRPLLGGSLETSKRAIARLMKKRRPFYERADFNVDTTTLTPAQTAVKIIKKLKRHEKKTSA